VTTHEQAPPSRDQERVVTEFRARGGNVGGYHATMDLLLLTTTGARTGQRRAVPLTYLPDGDRYIVTAGNAGRDRRISGLSSRRCSSRPSPVTMSSIAALRTGIGGISSLVQRVIAVWLTVPA
jgi:F420H(2)-dependent quinone reductase